jgi:uncharacterized protein YqjF (DUF2071 family)
VWFLSLDATNPLAVWAARWFFHLPYWRARIEVVKLGEVIRYTSRRPGKEPARFEARYRPASVQFEPQAGSLEAFLVERYCLYAVSGSGRMYRGEIHHHPWPLHRAEGEVNAGELLKTHGLAVGGDPVLHYSPGVDVVLWPFERVI